MLPTVVMEKSFADFVQSLPSALYSNVTPSATTAVPEVAPNVISDSVSAVPSYIFVVTPAMVTLRVPLGLTTKSFTPASPLVLDSKR